MTLKSISWKMAVFLPCLYVYSQENSNIYSLPPALTASVILCILDSRANACMIMGTSLAIATNHAISCEIDEEMSVKKITQISAGLLASISMLYGTYQYYRAY